MMPIPNRDAVALSARTLGALFSYAPNSAEIAPLVAAFPAFHPHLSLLHLRLFPITISQCFPNLAVTNASSSSLS